MLNFSVKYRPNNFDSFFGNEKTIRELKQRSKENLLPQVIYFTGISGCGKTTLQLIVAKSILCEKIDDNGNPCNSCVTCNTINNEKESLYFFNYNCSNVDIETARKIEELSMMKTLSNVKRKVIILDELQELFGNAKARKNLLKVLERQNKNTYFLLGSMDDSKVDRAVKNRAVTYRLSQSKTVDLAKYLKFICDNEKVDIEKNERVQTLLSISEYCKGDFRQAVSFLERVIYSELWTEKELLEELNIITTDKLSEIVNKLLQGDADVFQNSFNKEIIDQLIFILTLCYKYSKNVNLASWQKKYLNNINLVNVVYDVIENLLEGLFELNKFTYTTNNLIEFYILKNMRIKPSRKKRVAK